MSTVRVDESQLDFARGGPFYRWMQGIGLIRGEGPDVLRCTVAFLALTWFPLLALAILQGRALGPTPRESFLLDIATYARFFVAMPLLIVSERFVGPRLTSAALRFPRSGLLHPEDLPAFEAAAAQVARRRESLVAEVGLIGLAILGTWAVYHGYYNRSTPTWHVLATGSETRLSLAGLWYNLVAVPFLQFLGYRWLWRLSIWTGFLWTLSRLNLALVPTHADQAGGLGFLGTAHLSFGGLSAALGCPLSGEAAFRIVFEGAQVQSFRVPFAAYLILSVVIFLGPLLVFVAPLVRARLAGLGSYAALVNHYNQAFDTKWAKGRAPEDEALLGSPDIQSLADLGNAFDRVRTMRFVPFNRQIVLQMAASAALPFVPLLPLVMPVGEFLNLLAKALL